MDEEMLIETPVVIYSVELSVKEHNRVDVLEAKRKEIENLKSYGVYEKVDDKGQVTVGARWVITEKQGHDGQKTKVKARLVVMGFQEVEKEQSDSSYSPERISSTIHIGSDIN